MCNGIYSSTKLISINIYVFRYTYTATFKLTINITFRDETLHKVVETMVTYD